MELYQWYSYSLKLNAIFVVSLFCDLFLLDDMIEERITVYFIALLISSNNDLHRN